MNFQEASYDALKSKARADEATALLKEALTFLNSIEGAGYGGMAAFEVPRGNIRAFLDRSKQ